MPKSLICFVGLYSLWLCGASSLMAQDTLRRGFSFQEGFYASFSDWQANKPTSTRAVRASENRERNVLFIDADSAFLARHWGVVWQGAPYIRVRSQKPGQSPFFFVKIHVLGRICYYHYDDYEEKALVMPIYDPFSGRLLASKRITNLEKKHYEWMLHAETGVHKAFSKANLTEWVKDDVRLARTLSELKPKEQEEKLFKVLLIYNDRNPIQYPR